MDIGDLIGFGITVFLGIFAIMNPIANLPAFIGMTEGMPKKKEIKSLKELL